MYSEMSKGMYSEHSKKEPVQEQAVRDTLRSILESRHFSKSKRYPAFLEYVVTTTLKGNDDLLKESVLAIEVFSRSFDYDSANDSVVRVAAGEVRKRLAQYFAEHPDASVRIDLPIGSYTPEFHFPPHEAVVAAEEPAQLSEAAAVPISVVAELIPADVVVAQVQNSRTIYLQLGSVALVVLLIAAFVFRALHKPDPARDFWKTFIPNGQQALILPGKVASYSPKFGSLPEQLENKTSFYEGSAQPLEHVIVVDRICALFHEYHHDCDIYEASSQPLENLTGKALVLVGGFNNVWTMKLLAPLPYRLERDPNGTRAIIEHTPTGDVRKWVVQVDASGSQAAVISYIILARFHSDITDNTAVIIAGLDRGATVSGGDYLVSPGNLEQLYAMAPKGWEGKNFEAVLQTDVVSGSPGRPKIVAAKFW